MQGVLKSSEWMEKQDFNSNYKTHKEFFFCHPCKFRPLKWGCIIKNFFFTFFLLVSIFVFVHWLVKCSCTWVSVFIKKKNHQKERNEACERVFGIDSTAVLCISLSKRVQQLKQFIYNICLDMHEGYKFCFQPTIKARLFATVEIGKWDSQQRC